MDTLARDIRFALRMLAKNPAFTAVALITLALGIGVNSSLFSIVSAVLIRPLPYPQPETLTAIYQRSYGFEKASISYLNFLDWQTGNQTFTSMAAYRSADFNLTNLGESTRLRGDMVSASFFPMLGVAPILGRNFTPREDQVGGSPVVLISEGFWKRKLGGTKNAVGRTLTLNSMGHTVVGVIPASFHLDRDNDVFVPIGQWNDTLFRDRKVSMGTVAIGRLKEGVTLAQAQADLDTIAASLASAYPESNKGVGIGVYSLKTDMVGDITPFLLVLLAAVGFVLLIACANVANLLLARANQRAREFAIRVALGAGSGRIIRQLLCESVLLGLIAGVLGLVLATWCTPAILKILPSALPREGEIRLDIRVLLFTFGISVISGIVFGLAPALRTRKPDLHETLKEGGRGTSGGRHRVQTALVVLEMATSLVLLIGAGLMVRTLGALWAVNPGFDPRNALAFEVALDSRLVASPAAARAAMLELQRSLGAIPGIEAASLMAGSLPMSGDSDIPFWLDNEPRPASEQQMKMTLMYSVQPDYLRAMRIALLRGRFLTQHDDEHSPLIVVIDERLAQKYFPGQDPIGRHLNLDFVGSAEIVGVAGHIKHFGLDSDATAAIQPQIYLSLAQIPDQFVPLVVHGITAVVRTSTPPSGFTEPIRQAVSRMNSQQIAWGMQTMEEIVEDSLARRRFSMFLLGIFAGLALALSSIGVYGVISYLAGQRTHEIGIRMAVGAGRPDVLLLILGESLKMSGAGVLIGLVAAFGLTRLMSTMLFGVKATDPLTFIGVAAVLTVVALAASLIPAFRATRVNPTVALRYE
jgi:predicted permease